MALLRSGQSLRLAAVAWNFLNCQTMLHPHQLLLGLTLSAVVSLAAQRAGALSRAGSVAAWGVGAIVFGVGGWLWAAALLTFFGTSTALSRWRKGRKDSLGYEKGGRRDAWQVLANGGVAAACALLPLIFPAITSADAHLWFLAALAAANADTWATEIGSALGGRPWDLRTRKPAAPGTSGAVSFGGTLAALAGAALIGVLFAPDAASRQLVTAAGWGGALADSLLGAFVQAQWRGAGADGCWTERPLTRVPDRGLRLVGNDAVNLLSTLLAVCLAASLKK